MGSGCLGLAAARALSRANASLSCCNFTSSFTAKFGQFVAEVEGAGCILPVPTLNGTVGGAAPNVVCNSSSGDNDNNNNGTNASALLCASWATDVSDAIDLVVDRRESFRELLTGLPAELAATAEGIVLDATRTLQAYSSDVVDAITSEALRISLSSIPSAYYSLCVLPAGPSARACMRACVHAVCVRGSSTCKHRLGKHHTNQFSLFCCQLSDKTVCVV